MGYRTVIMLSNDMAHHWVSDPQLGQLIRQATRQGSYAEQAAGRLSSGRGCYGRVVQCVHADEQTLAVLDAYQGFTPLAAMDGRVASAAAAQQLQLLKEAADALGYRLVRKTKETAR